MTSVDKQTPTNYQDEVKVDFIDNIEDILLINDSNEMDNRIFKNMLNINKTLKHYYKRLSENFELTKEETDILLYCLKFIDTLNLFISNQTLESVLRLIEDIHEIANMINNLPQQEELVRKIRYTEKSIIYFKKRLFKYMFFGDGNQLGKEIEKYLLHISVNGNFDHRTFKQLQNIFYVVQGKIEEGYRKQIQAVFNEMKQGNIRSKGKRYSSYFDDYTDYTDYKNYDQGQTDYYDNYYYNNNTGTSNQYNRGSGSNNYGYYSGKYKTNSGGYNNYRNSSSYYDEQGYADADYQESEIKEELPNTSYKSNQNYYNDNYHKNSNYYDDKRSSQVKAGIEIIQVNSTHHTYGYGGNNQNSYDYSQSKSNLNSAANSSTPVKKNKNNRQKRSKQKNLASDDGHIKSSDNVLADTKLNQIESDVKKAQGTPNSQTLPTSQIPDNSYPIDSGTEVINVASTKRGYNNNTYKQSNYSQHGYKQHSNNLNSYNNNNYSEAGNNYNYNSSISNNNNYQKRGYNNQYSANYYNNTSNVKQYKNEDANSNTFNKKSQMGNTSYKGAYNYNNPQFKQQYNHTQPGYRDNSGYYNNQYKHEFVDLDNVNRINSSDQVTTKKNQKGNIESKNVDYRYQSDSGMVYGYNVASRDKEFEKIGAKEVLSDNDKAGKIKKYKDQFKSDDDIGDIDFEELEHEEFEDDEESSDIEDNEIIQSEFDNFIKTAKYENMAKMVHNDDYTEFEDETKNNKVIFGDDDNENSSKHIKAEEVISKDKELITSEENLKETTRGFLNSLKNIDPNVLLEIKNKLNQDNEHFKKCDEGDDKKPQSTDLENTQPDFNELYPSNFYQNQNMNKMSIQNYMYTNYAHFFFRGRDSNIHREYFALKCLEQENPAMVYKNLDSFEDRILIPIYQRINFNVNKRKGVYFYTYSKYQRLIYRILNKDKVLKKVKPYGSYMNNFLIDSGDIDICIVSKIGIVEFSNYLDKIKDEIVVQVKMELTLEYSRT